MILSLSLSCQVMTTEIVIWTMVKRPDVREYCYSIGETKLLPIPVRRNLEF